MAHLGNSKGRRSRKAGDTPPEGQRPKREQLLSAEFVEPALIKLTFADRSFSLPIDRLGMPTDRIVWKTAQANQAGTAMTLRAVKGELVPVESRTLRYLVDKRFAQQVDAGLKASQFSRSELEAMFGDNPPGPEWLGKPGRDLRLDSWK